MLIGVQMMAGTFRMSNRYRNLMDAMESEGTREPVMGYEQPRGAMQPGYQFDDPVSYATTPGVSGGSTSRVQRVPKPTPEACVHLDPHAEYEAKSDMVAEWMSGVEEENAFNL